MIKLYAQAAIYKPTFIPNSASFDLPKLPNTKIQKNLTINPKHCAQYNALTEWRDDISDGVHPNYVQTLSLSMQLTMMVNEPFPFKPMGLVHIANQIDVSFLPKQTANLQLTTSFGQVFYHRRGWLFEVITQASVGGKFALKGTSYYLARYKHIPEANKHHQQFAIDLPEWIAQLSHRKQVIADKFDTLLFPSNIGRRYAKISGDYNPIHLYPYTAKWLGFDKAIAHGMYSKAWAVSKLAQQKGFLHTRFSLKTVFVQPITLPLETHLFNDIQSSTESSGQDFCFSLVSNKRNKNRLHLIGTVSEYNF